MQGAARKAGCVKAARANAGMKIGRKGVRLPGRLTDKAGCERTICGQCGSRRIRAAHLLLSCLALLLALGPAAVRGEFFGYGSDWLSQHLPLAETLRSAMLDSGRLLPLYLHLGGGSSVYDFAYYGLLRPDILLGCLFPQVGMEYLLAGYRQASSSARICCFGGCAADCAVSPPGRARRLSLRCCMRRQTASSTRITS